MEEVRTQITVSVDTHILRVTGDRWDENGRRIPRWVGSNPRDPVTNDLKERLE